MIQKVFAAIVGNTAQGSRKMALGFFVIGTLAMILAAALVALWTISEAPGTTKVGMVTDLAKTLVESIKWVTGILILGNAAEWASKAARPELDRKEPAK